MGQRISYQQSEIYEQVKSIIETYLAEHLTFQYARVVDYDTKHHAVRLEIKPQLSQLKNITGWLPLLTPWAGPGWGMQASLVAGQSHVLVFFLGNPAGALFAVGPFFNKSETAPGVQAQGELVLKHKSGTTVEMKDDSSIIITHKTGSLLELNEDSSVAIVQAKGGSMEWKANGDIKISGVSKVDVHAPGDVNIGDVDGNLQTFPLKSFIEEVYNNHQHGGIHQGDSLTLAPDPQYLEFGANMTKVAKAD